MAMLPNIRIDLASTFDDKGFKKASKSSSLLGKQFKTLGMQLAAAMSIRSIIRFSQTAVKEFAADQEAALKLAKTFDNLGLSFQGAIANDVIDRLQMATTVTDDELRPALSTLARTTLDLGKAQELLNVALDVSAGTGASLESVTSALSKAYLGNTQSLARMNIGIGKVEAKTMSFDQIMERLNTRFSGQAALAADTYAGKLRKLSIAGEEARESIGERMVLALQLLSKDQTIDGLADDMQTFADKIGLATVGLGKLLGALNRKIEFGGRTLGEILYAAAGGGFIDALAQIGAEAEYTSGVKKRTLGAPGAMQQAKKDAETRKKLLAEQKKLIAMEKKAQLEKEKRERLAAAQRRARTIFDIENIQIVAAMQSKIDGEERLRLTALLALNTENVTAAEKLADVIVRLNAPALSNLGVIIQAGDTIDEVIQKLITSQAKLAGLQLMAEDFPELDNIFEDWETSLENILKMLMEMFNLLNNKKALTGIYGVDALGFSSPEAYRDYRAGERGDTFSNPSGFNIIGSSSMSNGSVVPSNYNNSNMNVVVNVAGNVTTEKDLVSAITEQLYVQQKSGKQVFYSSLTV